jgi:tRNA pseudouridine38-40 synthase
MNIVRSYKIVIAYDGTDYYGWQRQPTLATIVGTLEETFFAVFQQSISIIGASRTDAGVHSLGQVALFHTAINSTGDAILRAWNNKLPAAIYIRSIELVNDSFHPQRNVLQKTYYYHLFKQSPLPFFARYGVCYKRSIDPEKLLTCLKLFAGTHDFRSFCTGYDRESTIRTIDSIEMCYLRRFGLYRIIIKGPGFLRYMIRRIVGASLCLASSTSRSPLEITQALQECDPEQDFYTALAQGLLLRKIIYRQE